MWVGKMSRTRRVFVKTGPTTQYALTLLEMLALGEVVQPPLQEAVQAQRMDALNRDWQYEVIHTALLNELSASVVHPDMPWNDASRRIPVLPDSDSDSDSYGRQWDDESSSEM
jgi:hypothetical protein